VAAEKACISNLLETLEAEDEALRSGRLTDLPALTEQKSQLLLRIAEIDFGRESLQAQLGFPAGRAGVELAASGDRELAKEWVSLLAVASRVRDLNRRVGAKVYTHLEFTRNSLAFLQARSQPLYGRDGSRRATAGGTSLALG